MALEVRDSARRRASLRPLWRVAALALAAWPLVAWGAARALVVSGVGAARADAIVVLAGAPTYVERTRAAAQLWREGRAPKVLLTDDNLRGGWSAAQQRNPLFVERARDELLRAGVPADQIEVLPGAISSTYDEAVLLRDQARARGFRSILVVTSGYHSRRALWTFRRVVGESGVEIGLESAGTDVPSPLSWWLSPGGWESVAGEYLKILYYRVSYG